ncbi:hypothetical protein BJX99DRAFT_254778 [Aspergillus californicus]
MPSYPDKDMNALVQPPKRNLEDDVEPSASEKDPTNDPRCTFLDLPVDILVLISPHLAPQSQANLALTCTPLYNIFCTVFDKELAWPRLLAHKGLENFGRPLNDLLLSVANDKWIYCSTYIKLHPPDHFSPRERASPTATRRCLNDLQGVVDICACVAITVPDGKKVTEWLKIGAGYEPAVSRRVRKAFTLQVLTKPSNQSPDRPDADANADVEGEGKDETQHALIHSCSITSQPDTLVTVAMTLTLSPKATLQATTKYTIIWTTPRPPKNLDTLTYEALHGTRLAAVCPHMHMFGWLLRHFFAVQV